MKAIDLTTTAPTLAELLRIASEDNVILRTAEGREFVLAEIDDFAHEVTLVRQNKALMKLLAERSQEKTRYTLDEVKKRLRKK